MKKSLTTCAMLSCAMVLAGTADADIVPDTPVLSPFDNAAATVEFMGSSAGFNGNLYYLGRGDTQSVLSFAENSDETGLGQLLVNNHHTATGYSASIADVFRRGDVLHFAYNVVDGIPETFRTDVARDTIQFAYDAENGMYGIEDLRFPYTDGDYNDVQVRVSFAQVPAPGALALLGAALVSGTRRRRR